MKLFDALVFGSAGFAETALIHVCNISEFTALLALRSDVVCAHIYTETDLWLILAFNLKKKPECYCCFGHFLKNK